MGGIALPLHAGLSDLLLPHSPSLSSMSPASIWTSLWHARVPRGFENFVPKKDKNKSSEDGTKDNDSFAEKKESGGSKKEDDSSSPFGNVFGSQGGKKQKQSSGGGSGGDPNSGGGGPNSQQSLAASAVLLLLVYVMLQLTDDDNANGGGGDAREITWSEFYNHMLEPGEVEKIVVTNKGTTARVFLKPGARGLPYGSGMRGGAFSGLPQGRRGGATGAIGSAADQRIEDEDETVMEMGGSSSSGTAGANSSQLPLSNSAYQPPLVYRFAIGSVDSFERKLDEAQRELGVDPRHFVPVQYAADSTVATELLSVLPSLLLVGVVFAMMRGAAGAAGGGGMGGGGPGGMFKFGKSNAKKISQEDISVTFRDVAGCREAKKEIMEFVDFLQDSTRFTKLGAKIPKGALLCGPPGTGKTLLAKAVAGEAGVPFFSISGSDFIEMFVGVGPSRVRDLFKEARATAPCIIFIDEIDAIGRKRGRGGAAGGNDERENTLNQLLVEMDGFNPSTGVVVLAGTNRADVLDEALTRPGRFDRQVVVDKPDLQGRKEIFLVHLQGITLEGEPEDVAGRLAGLTPGFAGADIANICNEAAIVAARRKADTVAIEDFEKATDRVVGGLESNKIISKEEREIVAHHEAGHAVAGWFLEHADPLLKVTIIPRSSGALGFAQYLPKEVFLRTEEQIMDIVSMALAGRAAEEVFFGDVTTGASNDLQKVTNLIYSTIQLYGMNNKVGQLAFPKDPNAFFDEKPYSAKTAKLMDEQAKEIVDKAYERTINLIREKKAEVEAVAKSLLEKETIVHDDMIDLIGARPFKGDPAYEEFIKRKQADKEAHKDDNKKSEDDAESSEEEEGGGGLTPGIA